MSSLARIRLLPPYPAPGGWLRLELLADTAQANLPRPPRGRAGVTVLDREGGRVELAGRAEELAELARGLSPAELGSALLEALGTLSREPAPWRLGSALWSFGERTYILGIINVTPDSISGDGVGADALAAKERAIQLAEEGADAIDLGGESTRPGHQPVAVGEEIERVVPALRAIRSALRLPIFVDTSKAEVARACLSEGATGINDVWGLRRDPEMAGVVARAEAPLICMHNQQGAEYGELMEDIADSLRHSLTLAGRAGIAPERVMLDPGIGFGKDSRQNLEVLRRLPELRLLGRPLLVGTSRKSTIGWLLGGRPPPERVLGTAASVVWAAAMGAQAVRVHDVAAMRDALLVADALARGREPARLPPATPAGG